MLDKRKLLGLMVEKDISRKQLAKLLNLTEKTVSRKINGPGCFDTVEAEKICEALGIIDGASKANIFLA